jgi:hypothetical protein
VVGVTDSGTESGVCYAKSPLTGNWYRVTEWEKRGDGKIVAEKKEEVDRSDVPDEWVEATEEKMSEVDADAE